MVVGRLALVCQEYLKKGQQIFVEGRLHTREWESNGATARRTEIVAGRVQFLGAPPTDSKMEESSMSTGQVAGLTCWFRDWRANWFQPTSRNKAWLNCSAGWCDDENPE